MLLKNWKKKLAMSGKIKAIEHNKKIRTLMAVDKTFIRAGVSPLLQQTIARRTIAHIFWHRFFATKRAKNKRR